ncbi:cytosolic acyl coenzyme A thioester hydrolase isoform X12 [Megalobrama amblycephala]|uniref:cytosolic acyl coenzyme A thioester hydrolase isoform X12 n=1 Tax=Megalobrama amblycephala TaxID=75352 RepID=UPI002014189F|nr:cytosolic acyl coenzyme A thioester hydrolase isoform X12 [Megalobrama amblycephala]
MVMRQNQLFHYLWKQNWGARKPNSTSRIMRPDDANIVGNVHGGTILKMIEEAGCIIGTRHCNTQTGDRCVAALARVERTDFLYPMFIGEVAHVSAEITYTSKHSVEVQINVLSENIVTGTKKVTNKATLWYVPLSLQNVDKIIEVPPIEYSSSEQEEAGKKRYEAQKLERLETKERNGEILMSVSLPEPYTVAFSQSSLIHLIGPSDCTMHGFVHGGCQLAENTVYCSHGNQQTNWVRESGNRGYVSTSLSRRKRAPSVGLSGKRISCVLDLTGETAKTRVKLMNYTKGWN